MNSDDHTLNSEPTMTFGYSPAPQDEPSLDSAPTMGPGGDVSKKRPPSFLGQIDQYQLVCKLGGGGFGVVYLARDTVSGVDVALKTLHPLLKSNPEEMEALRTKFALVSRLSHPNIASLLVLHPCRDIVITDEDARRELRLSPGDNMMVMRYAPGVTLSKWRKQFPGGIVPLDLVLEVARQIASALDYAHGERIVHRDIKPSNVVVETTSPQPDSKAVLGLRVRILDFGLAAEIRSSMSRVSTETGNTSGTRPYMAPEQWLGRKQDGRTDQYALACVLYEMLSGAPPFGGVFELGDPVIMERAVMVRAPEEIEGVPAHVNAALMRALAKDPKARFESCAAFVRSCLAPSPQRPQRDVGAERTGRFPESGVGDSGSAKSDNRIPKTELSSPVPPRSRGGSIWPWVAAALMAGAVAIGLKVWHDREVVALSSLASIKQAAASSVAEARKYSAIADAGFPQRFATLNAAKMNLDAIESAKDLGRARSLRGEIAKAAEWIVENGLKREALSAKEAALLKLVPEQERVAASSLAKGTYDEAKREEERAKTLCANGDFDGAGKAYDEAEILFRKAIDEAKAVLDGNSERLASLKADANAKAVQANEYIKWADGPFKEKFSLMRKAQAGLDAISNPQDLQTAQGFKKQVDDAAKWIVENGPKREVLSAKEDAIYKLVPELEQFSVDSLAKGTYEEAKREEERAKTLCANGDFDGAGKAYDEAESLLRKAIAEAERRVKEEAEHKAREKVEKERQAREEVKRKEAEHKVRKEAARKAGERMVVRVGSQEIALRWCPPGSFIMGSPASEKGRFNNETEHRVTLTKGFWMGETEVTQGLWKELMGSAPSSVKYGDDYPVENVSWNVCQELLRELNTRNPQCGLKWTLPTEAQWEYACRAGISGAYGGTGRLDDMGWYASNSGNATHPVIGKRPNAWGLYDMHGNVWEWCQDWYGGYPSGAVTDPTGPAFGADRVQRGGSYWESSRDCRSAVRLRRDPGMRFRNGGFRLLAISDGETVDAKADEVLSLGADNADAEFTNAAQEDTEAKRKVRQRGKTITRRLSENTR